MKQRVLLKGVVSKVSFPDKGTLIPTGDQPARETWPEAPAGFSYTEPQKPKEKLSIEGVLPGQTWLVSTHLGGRFSRECRPEQLLEKAPYEKKAPCPYAETCGGCAYQTVPYEKQLQMKEQQVRELLGTDPQMKDTIARGDFLPITPSPLSLGYRNKMEFSFGDEEKGGPLTLGMHRKNAYHDILSTPQCMLAPEPVREAVRETESYFRASGMTYFSTYRHDGQLRHLCVRFSFSRQQMLLNLVTTSAVSDEDLSGWVSRMKSLSCAGQIAGVLHTCNDALGDVVQSDKTDILYGQDFVTETLLGLDFKIFPFSFFQTNSRGAEALYSLVREMAGDVSRKTVFDLYCGTGTIAQVMAAAGASHVKGIEIVPETVKAARENAAMNGLSNCEFLCGDVLKLVDSLGGQPDLIILDPPRAGVTAKAIPKILAYQPRQIIYVSCQPTSLVRDLPAFEQAGYRILKAGCCDMFPNALPIESVVLMSHELQENV